MQVECQQKDSVKYPASKCKTLTNMEVTMMAAGPEALRNADGAGFANPLVNDSPPNG